MIEDTPFKFHEQRLLPVSSCCGRPSWINYISEDQKSTGYFCTHCEQFTTLREMTAEDKRLSRVEALSDWQQFFDKLLFKVNAKISRDAVL